VLLACRSLGHHHQVINPDLSPELFEQIIYFLVIFLFYSFSVPINYILSISSNSRFFSFLIRHINNKSCSLLLPLLPTTSLALVPLSVWGWICSGGSKTGSYNFSFPSPKTGIEDIDPENDILLGTPIYLGNYTGDTGYFVIPHTANPGYYLLYVYFYYPTYNLTAVYSTAMQLRQLRDTLINFTCSSIQDAKSNSQKKNERCQFNTNYDSLVSCSCSCSP
jgi:hypothetical protein